MLAAAADPEPPVASACRFLSENSTEFSLRAPVIAWEASTRGLGAEVIRPESGPAAYGLADACTGARANRSGPALTAAPPPNRPPSLGASSANGSAPIDG